MGLDSDKTSKFFVLIFAVFLPGFSVSCTTWHGLTQVSSKLCMCSISTPHKTRMFTVRLADNGHGFAVAVLALAMPLDHPNFAATVQRISLPGAQKAILNFKKIIITNLVKCLSLDSKFVVVYKVSSKPVHTFCPQTPITAKYSMRGY